MRLPWNGKTTAAVVSCICTVLICGGTVAGWYAGRETKIKQAAVREQRLDDLLLAAPRVDARMYQIETAAATTNNKVDNLDHNVQTLIASQERTNEEMNRTNERLQRLSSLLMKYLADHGRNGGAR